MKLLRGGEHLVRDLQDLAETIRLSVVAIGVDEKAAHHEFQGVLVAEVVEVLEHRGLGPVVGVHEAQVLTAGMVHGKVARGGSAGVFLVKHAHAHVTGGIEVQDAARVVG